MALIELDCLVSSGAALAAVLALQELGLQSLRLRGGRAEAVLQSKAQDDVLPGTCVELLRLVPPGCLEQRRDIPHRWRSLLGAEASLAAQRSHAATAAFRGLELWVPSEQLRPRKASEVLVEAALDCLRAVAEPRVLDLGCGCGALLLSILKELRGRGTGLDIDSEALEACETNARSVGLAEKA